MVPLKLMWIKNLNNAAFSLLEVLLASIIFVISITGVFVTLTAVRKPVADKESALSAAVFGKQVLEALRSQVDARTSANYYSDPYCSGSGSGIVCTDFSLAVGTHQVPVANLPAGLSWPPGLITLDSVTYPNGNPPVLNYTVLCADGTYTTCAVAGVDEARQVNLSINWPDAP